MDWALAKGNWWLCPGAAEHGQEEYTRLRQEIRASPVVYGDETGWRQAAARPPTGTPNPASKAWSAPSPWRLFFGRAPLAAGTGTGLWAVMYGQGHPGKPISHPFRGVRLSLSRVDSSSLNSESSARGAAYDRWGQRPERHAQTSFGEVLSAMPSGRSAENHLLLSPQGSGVLPISADERFARNPRPWCGIVSHDSRYAESMNHQVYHSGAS